VRPLGRCGKGLLPVTITAGSLTNLTISPVRGGEGRLCILSVLLNEHCWRAEEKPRQHNFLRLKCEF
jgi:hypothetical protein